MSQSEGQALRYVGVAFRWVGEDIDEQPVGEFEDITRAGVVDWARAQVADGGGRVRVFIVCEELVQFSQGWDWVGTGVTGDVDPSGAVHWCEPAVVVNLSELACPVCGGVDVTGDECEIDGDVGQAWQRVACDDCGSSWIDVYAFSCRENVRRGDRVEIARARQAVRS